MSTPIDPRTGRPVGDHGSAADAIAFTLDSSNHDHDPANALAFLGAWSEGSAFEEWPEFYSWLRKREEAEAEAEARRVANLYLAADAGDKAAQNEAIAHVSAIKSVLIPEGVAGMKMDTLLKCLGGVMSPATCGGHLGMLMQMGVAELEVKVPAGDSRVALTRLGLQL